jgi:hypothetical protein
METLDRGAEAAPVIDISGFEPQKLFETYLQEGQGFGITDREVEIVERLANNNSAQSLYFAGGIALDLAFRPGLTADDTKDWFNYAGDTWEAGINHRVASTRETTAHLACDIGMACLPSYEDVFIKGEIPDRGTQTMMYERLCGIAERNNALAQRYSAANQIDRAKGAHGKTAELAVLLLHQRYTSRQTGPNAQMVALPALVSQRDNFTPDEEGKVNAWDISIIAKTGGQDMPILKRKVEVKTSKRVANNSVQHDSGVIVVNTMDDLVVTPTEYQQGLPLAAVEHECNHELNGHQLGRVIPNLDRRTAKLLKIIG